MNKGGLAEVFAGLEMVKYASPFAPLEVFYWQSLRAFMTAKQSPFGIRVCLENFGQYDNIKVCPLYAINTIIGVR